MAPCLGGERLAAGDHAALAQHRRSARDEGQRLSCISSILAAGIEDVWCHGCRRMCCALGASSAAMAGRVEMCRVDRRSRDCNPQVARTVSKHLEQHATTTADAYGSCMYQHVKDTQMLQRRNSCAMTNATFQACFIALLWNCRLSPCDHSITRLQVLLMTCLTTRPCVIMIRLAS